MTICTYDNPNTMHRECWQNGKLLYSYSANVLTTIPPEKFFFGANIGPWDMEQLVGDKRAMERPQEFVDNIIEIKHQGVYFSQLCRSYYFNR